MENQAITHLEYTISLVEQRAAESHLDLKDASHNILSKLFTNTTNETEFLRFVQESASIDNEEMAQILQAEIEIHSDRKFKKGLNPITQYFVRSIKLTCQQFMKVLHDYSNEYYDESYIQRIALTFRFDEYLSSKKPDDILFLRYVGCTSASTPLKRQQEDNTSKKQKRRYNNMYDIIERHGLVRNQVVYSFPLLEVEGQYGLFNDPNRQLIDETEQVLIHLFGRNVLMNSQSGGFYHQYSPSDDDRELISNIDLVHARTFLTEDSANIPIQTEDYQKQIGIIYQQYRNKLIQQVDGCVAKKVTDSYIQFLTDAALPKTGRLIHNDRHVPLAIFASTMNRENSQLKRNFFEGCRAGTASLSLLQQIIDTDNSFSSVSFVNLWVTSSAHKDLLPLHISTAGSVFECLHPLTMVTYGYEAAAVAYSNFHGRHSLNESEYGSVIGEPILINYNVSFNYEAEHGDGEPSDELWTVIVPHFDMGNLNYGSIHPQLFRLSFLCWVRSLLLVDCCISLLERNNTDPRPGSRAFGQLLIEELHKRELKSDVSQKLKEARTFVQEWRHSDAKGRLAKTILRETSPPENGLFSKAGKMGGKLGYKTHCERYGYTNHNTDHPKTNIYQALIRLIQAEHHSPMGNLEPAQVQYIKVQCKQPEGFDDDTWMLDPDLVSEALRKRASIMWTAGTTPAKREANKRNLITRLNNEGKKAVKYFTQVPINILANGRAHIRVELDGEEKAEPDGMWIIGSGANVKGKYILDYDPNICTTALIIKDLQGSPVKVQDNYILIADQWLLSNSRDKYFRTFVNTVQLFGQELRPIIKEESERSVAFSGERMIQLFMEEYCSENELIVSTSQTLQDNIPTFQSLMDECLQIKGTNFEKEIWNHWMTMPTGYALARPTITNLPSTTSKRGGATITNDDPFLEWWREFHNNVNGDEVTLNFSNTRDGFWGEFATIEERRGINDESVKQYLAVRDVKKSQSLNALAKRYGWIITKVKNGLFTWKAPAKQPPNQAMRKRSKCVPN
ncbi:hypothetical protein INT45_005521 [Circinella minor]|uniref:Uncharacterized protein n=1 Tax=Circinella minor TaxID=1195481 RepID=A0A8H7RMS3_9FUNG|nr:hypothetical protein INT45_005521 [Circinella minor]